MPSTSTGPEYPRDHSVRLARSHAALRDGRPVIFREVTPADRHLLETGFDQLSPQSRLFRFLAPHKALSSKELDTFTALNDSDHMAIGARLDTPGPATPLGIARFVRLDEDATAAEFALTIVDTYQHQGLGSLMFGMLARLAAENGITTLVGLVHPDNEAMLGLLEQIGGSVADITESDVSVYVPIYKDAQHYPATRVGDAFRAAYEQAELTG